MNLKTNFTKGEENAQDGLNDNFSKIDPMISDTGWINGTWGNGIESYGSDQNSQICFRKIGNLVYLKGIAKSTKVLPAGPYNIVINIPEEFIPSDNRDVPLGMMQGSVKNTWYCSLSVANRAVVLDRYGVNSSGDVPANQWLPFAGSYSI